MNTLTFINTSGLIAGINLTNKILEKEELVFPVDTMIGALCNYISTENDKFQPMNANFGILPKLPIKIKDKQERYKTLSDKSLSKMKEILNNTNI